MALLVASFLPMPSAVTAAVSILHVLLTLAGLGLAGAALARRRWLATAPFLVCGFFLWVQWYWFYEWIT
jgi:hypothetical protein